MPHPNPNVFCNSPWYELHVYWNGDYGFCCQQFSTPYEKSLDNPYNILKMSIRDWYNSNPMREARLKMFKDDRWNLCGKCWQEESLGSSSRRHRQNQKSVIFKSQFADSFNQSPNYKTFMQSDQLDHLPVDLHIDLGNYCNLACKMCWSGASSKIATQEKKWGTLVDASHLGLDWTKNKEVWERFLGEIIQLPLMNIHFMGGETLIQPKFEELIDHLINNNKTDFGISFVTNGTTVNTALIEKLSKFKRVGIEVSIEATTVINSYVRQGTDTQNVLDNIKLYQSLANNNIEITIRSAVSALTVRDFWTLLKYCLDNQLLIKSLIVNEPSFMQVAVLPNSIRQKYKQNYLQLIDNTTITDINESNPHNYQKVISHYAHQVINLLDSDELSGIDKLINHMKKWDNVYQFDAKKLYPELKDIFDKYGY